MVGVEGRGESTIQEIEEEEKSENSRSRQTHCFFGAQRLLGLLANVVTGNEPKTKSTERYVQAYILRVHTLRVLERRRESRF